MAHHRSHLSLLVSIILLTTLLPPLHAGDPSPPRILTTYQSAQTIRATDSITLCAEAMDETGLDTALLITNESGSWKASHSWYDAHWHRSMKLTINHDLIPADFTNFTFLVNITNPDFCSHAQANGNDFIFIDPTNATRYPHEIDSFNPVTGCLNAWVLIPYLSSNSNTILYLYYGNPTCPNQQDPARVWNGYLLVHHFTGTSLIDSAHRQETQAVGTPDYNETGIVGTSITLNHGDNIDYLLTPTFRLPADTSFTIMTWTARTEGRMNRSTLVQGIGSGHALQVSMRNHVQCNAGTTTGSFLCNSTYVLGITPLVWYELGCRVDATRQREDIFINGSLDSSLSFTGSLLPESIGLVLGANISHLRKYTGHLDELRIYQGLLSDAWIATEYHMIWSPGDFLTTGAVKVEPDPDSAIIQLEGTSEPQWANFTWHHGDVKPGSTVGWFVVFRDGDGNQNQTPISSFTILNEPPLTPGSPGGPSWAEVGADVTFSVVTTDPNGAVLSYQMDFGDGTTSDWTMPAASGIAQQVTHSWQQPGVYFVKVQARGVSGVVSDWSLPASIVIMEATSPSLMISAPLVVVERTNYTVGVTANGLPVAGAVVSLLDLSVTTNASGEIGLIAPSVSRSQSCRISVVHEGFQPAVATMIIVRSDSSASNGWVYGVVQSSSGVALSDVVVSARSVDGDLSHCVLSDHEGGYTLSLAPGAYLFEVEHEGFALFRETLVVSAGQAQNEDVVLSAGPQSNESAGAGEGLMEAVIEAGVLTDTISGRLDVSADGQCLFSSYDEGVVASLVRRDVDGVSFVVSATNRSGSVFVVRLASAEVVAGVDVLVDDATIREVGVGGILQEGGDVPVYAVSMEPGGGGMVVYCFVYLPHWSSHVVAVERVRGVGSSGSAVVLYVGVGVLVGLGVVLPIVAIERRRR